jgi:hypothetical protein
MNLRTLLPLSVLAACLPAFGQAIVESSAASALATGAAAGAKGVGASIKGIARSLDAALEPASRTASASPSTSSITVSVKSTNAGKPPSAAPKAVYEAAAGIETGITREELLRRFGPPAMQITGEDGATAMTFGGGVQVEVRDGKVISVSKPKTGA